MLKYHVLVVGSGAAAYNAVYSLHLLGVTGIALITEGVNCGTSRNTGSDKQTFYKLSLSGDAPDSVQSLADDLMAPCTHGDHAFVNAAYSARSFSRLCDLGVPFPKNAYGEYVGYQTDHDTRSRATSAGPLTSKYMTECLQKAVEELPVDRYETHQVIRLLQKDGRIQGLTALDLSDPLQKEVTFLSGNVILATGGEACLYADRVYPESQHGMLGLILLCGAEAENLNLWQYGIASVDFRWNLSGTFQQVIPRYFYTGQDGTEHELFEDCPDKVFLKGYQWPFDAAKVPGSSEIDLKIHELIKQGCRVYMDFTRNPEGFPDAIGPEAETYLRNSGALFGTPVERLDHMNPNAIRLYLDHGIDLRSEPLRIAVCAQHQNGGISVDSNGETNIRGLYVCGEAAATFGLSRPGGSALLATQTFSQRIAEAIASDPAPEPGPVSDTACFCPDAGVLTVPELDLISEEISREMSSCASHIRIPSEYPLLRVKVQQYLQTVRSGGPAGPDSRSAYYRLLDQLTATLAVLSALDLAAERLGSSGGALTLGDDGSPCPAQPSPCIIRTRTDGITACSEAVLPRPMPCPERWFENVWRAFRESDQRSQ